MASQIFERGPSSPRMNITPLIDVVFQLIVFFMLVNTIASEQIIQLVLPDLDNPHTIQLEEVERIIVNIGTRDYDRFERGRGQNVLSWPGDTARIRVGTQNVQVGDINRLSELLREARNRNPEVQVFLRGDAALYYEEMRPIMRAIADAEIVNLNMVAYMEED